MTRLHRVLALGLGAASGFAMPPGQAADQPRQLTGFTEIHVEHGVELQVMQGAAFRVTASSRRGALSKLDTVVQGHRLKISRNDHEPSTAHRDDGYLVQVTLPVLNAIYASGGAKVSGLGAIDSEVMALVLSEGAELELRATVRDMHVRTHGGARARVTGEGREIDVQGHDGSRIDTVGFVSQAVDASSEDGSDVRVAGAPRVRGEASNGARLTIVGAAGELRLKTHTGGDIVAPELLSGQR